MKTLLHRLLVVIAASALVGVSSLPLEAQVPPRIYEPLRRTPEYKEAQDLADRGALGRLQAIAKFQQIAAQNPGTTLGAEALFEVAYWCEDIAQARAAYNTIIGGWPQSHFEIEAREALIQLNDPAIGNAGYASAVEALIVSFGGPSLRQMQRGEQRQIREFGALPYEIRRGLISPFSGLAAVLINQLNRYDEGLAVAQFAREVFLFAPMSSEQFSQRMDDALTLKKYGTVGGFGVDPTPPTIRILAPKAGKKKGPRPKIRAEIVRNDFRQADINIGSLEFTLDGQDLRPVMRVRSKMNVDMKPDRPFERFRLRARPTERLAPGVHTVVVAANGARASWTFRVDKPDDDLEDCEEDDPEDD